MKLKRKNLILIIVCITFILGMILYRLIIGGQKEKNSPVTVAQVAKSISLMYHTTEQCAESSNYYDSHDNKWYIKYMNTMYSDGFYDEKNIPATEKSASIPFTYGKLKELLDKLDIDDKDLLKYTKKNRKSKKISTVQWSEIYEKILNIKNTGNIEKKTLTIVGTISNVPSLDSWKTVTDNGTYDFEGLNLDYYIDNKIEVFLNNNEIVWVKDKISDEVTYKNVWIVNSNSKSVKVFMYGVNREIIISGTGKDMINSVADIYIKNNSVERIDVKKESISGKVLSSDYNYVEIEGYGKVPLEDDYKVYKIYGNLEEKGIRDILVGYDSQIFIVASGKICAAVIDRDVNAKNIRVLISNKDYSSIFHDSVIVSSSGGMTITYGDKKIIADPGEKVLVEKSSGILSEGRARFASNDIKGTIKIDSIKRSYGNPSYRGSIEVALSDDGLTVVNELALEEYLYGVVPSEMPASYPEEALKAQAVCARTYAYKHLLSNTYNKYGAHVDDSTSFQVYKNSEEQESSNKAVNDTYGTIITCEDEPIMAYFYSTSCGSTADGNIWGAEVPYLKSVLLSRDGKKLDLSNESVFSGFIKSSYDTYESDYPWFRWNVEFSLTDINKLINEKIGNIYKTNNNHVLTLVNGSFLKKNTTNIGVLKNITIGERGSSGVVESVIFEGTEATVKVLYQSNLRKIFSPQGLLLNKNDNTTVKTMKTLPSGFFTLEEIKENGVLTGYKLYGGGYGHGAGMSQNGARGMAEELYGYEDILKKFYNGIMLKNIYSMEG